MTDVRPTPDDELASAYLDAEATQQERSRVESDSDLSRQVAVLRELTAQIGGVTAPGVDDRDDNIAAALAVFDAEIAQATIPRAPTVVDDLDTARRRRQSRSLALLGAAAALVVAVLVTAGILTSRVDRSDSLAARSDLPSATRDARTGAPPAQAPAPSKMAEAGTAGADRSQRANPSTTRPAPDVATGNGPNPEAPASGSETTTGGVYVGDLGSVAGTSEFRVSIATQLAMLTGDGNGTVGASRSAPPAQTATRLQDCDTRLRAADSALGTIVMTGSAKVNNTNALVLVYTLDAATSNAGGAHRAYAVGPNCSILESQTV